MSAARILRKIAAFFWRDFQIARGYRMALLAQTVEEFFGVATFYYLARFVDSPQLERALPAGANYFAFALVGFAFFDYLNVSMTAFDSSLEEARQNRTLEALLVTQTRLPVILAGSAVYPFVALALRTCVYLAMGALFFGFAPRTANWPGALLILLASILAFAGLGILSASYQILFKRGNPAKWIVLGVSGLVGGMMYPVAVLPAPLRMLARIVPVTYSLEGMRAALLEGAGWSGLWHSLVALLVFAAVLIPLSFAVFAWALRRTRITGTLTHI
ncbi:MAG: ABC transporter permease [Acidobacteriia bacterium]|nr:ABC transporter permease [Terriglobia bacterium]